MKKSFIFLSILIIGLIAFFDASERLKQLDEISANTPSQVEMKQMMNQGGRFSDMQAPAQNRMNETGNETFNKNKEFRQNMQNKDLQNQLDNVERRRNTIDNPVN